jgi:Domain of unknown function (DUF4142)
MSTDCCREDAQARHGDRDPTRDHHPDSIETRLGRCDSSTASPFKAQMVADHKATIALFQTEAKSGGDADLKAFATKTCPICRST